MAQRKKNEYWNGNDANCTGHSGFFTGDDDHAADRLSANNRSADRRFRTGPQNHQNRHNAKDSHIDKTEKEVKSRMDVWFTLRIDLKKLFNLIKFKK